MNDKIEQRARELLAAEYERRNWDSVFVAKVRRGAYTTATDDAALRAIAAALRENTKPEAQAAGEVMLLPMPSKLLNAPHPVDHMAIREYAMACVEAALSTPASHDAQQRESCGACGDAIRTDPMTGTTCRCAHSYDAMAEALRQYGRHEHDCETRHDSAFKDRPKCTCGFSSALAKQPAVVGDGVQLMNDALAEAFKDDPAAAVRAHAAMLPLVSKLVALTPAATSGDDGDWYVDPSSGSYCVDLETDAGQRMLSLLLKPNGQVSFAAYVRGQKINGDAACDGFWEALATLASAAPAQKEGNGNG